MKRSSMILVVLVVGATAGLAQVNPPTVQANGSCTADACREGGRCQKIDIARCAYPHAATETLPSGSTCAAIPSCSIPDRDGDGLNDAWEQQGGIDLDCDGEIDGTQDLVLSGANPSRPDIYLTFDWMALPDQGTACTTTADCDSGQRCVENVCRGHSHRPHPRSLQAVVDAFRRQGTVLHLAAGRAIPHSMVVTYAQVVSACTGNDAVNFYEVKEGSFDPRRKLAYHYAIFGHYNTCDSVEDCATCPLEEGGPAVFGSTGKAELPGNDFIVSPAAFFDLGFPLATEHEAGLLMHELGHNFRLRHGGQDDLPAFKPNYLSVVNRNFTFTGIPVALFAGSTEPISCRSNRDCPREAICGTSSHVCTRIDYSERQLATLDELSLDESLGIAAGTRDITTYNCPDATPASGSASGPIDWNCDDNATETNVAADVNADGALEGLMGWADWPHLQLAFQCTAAGSANAPPPKSLSVGELSVAEAIRKHILHARRTVDVQELPATGGGRLIAILGGDDLEVADIDASSLRLSSARPTQVTVFDANGDGRADLVLTFDVAAHLAPAEMASHLTGWLRNSQTLDGKLRRNHERGD